MRNIFWIPPTVNAPLALVGAVLIFLGSPGLASLARAVGGPAASQPPLPGGAGRATDGPPVRVGGGAVVPAYGWLAGKAPWVGYYWFGKPDATGDIIAKVASARILTVRFGVTKIGPHPFKRIAVAYVVRVIYSDSKLAKAGQTVVLSGGLGGNNVGGYTFGPPGTAPPALIMRPGATFVASIIPVAKASTTVRRPLHNEAKGRKLFTFAGQSVLPIGVPVPSVVRMANINKVKQALAAWGEARRSWFHFYPFPNVLPAKQAAALMASKNYYLWALGVSSYCGGANREEITLLIKRYFYATKAVTIRQPGCPAVKYRAWRRLRMSQRRAAWLLYASAVYPVPWCRLTGWCVAGLMQDYLYRRARPRGNAEVLTLPSPWMHANRASTRFKPFVANTWTYRDRGIGIFPPGPGTAPKGAYVPISRKASISAFMAKFAGHGRQSVDRQKAGGGK